VQVNGGGGVQFNDGPTASAAATMAAAHRRLGTVAILPTLITSPCRDMRAAGDAMAQMSSDSGVLGVHFEGPFLSAVRPGVHRRDLIRPPDAEDVAWLVALAARCRGRIVLTLAPEMVPRHIQATLAEAGVILSAGHSEAEFDAVQPPLRGITHIFNAMPPPSSRAPGLAAAGMLGDLFVGLILDLLHVHPAMARLLLRAHGVERTLLVSDAMKVTGTDATEFDLLGQKILRRNGRLETEAGVLAGADLCLAQAVRNAATLPGVREVDAIAMASAVPADFLGLSQERGRIAPGLRADLVLLDPALHVLGTWLGGAWQGEPGIVSA
jgi:N-acetylglucosamine-6-phosphate deacetylase